MAIYEIAFYLRIPIYELSQKMTYEELLGWYSYFEQRPFGWRDDDRTAKLLQAQGVKESSKKLFPSLAMIYSKAAEKPSDKGLRTSLLFQKMLSAKNGENIAAKDN